MGEVALVHLVGAHPVVLGVVEDGQQHGQLGQRVGQAQGAAQTGVDHAAVTPLRHLRVEGLSTHLARADEPDRPETAAQLVAFDRYLAAAASLGIDAPWIHAANTAATLLHPAARHTLVRPGIGIYGLSPDLAVDAADHGLRGALSLVSEVSFVKQVPADTPLSYGHRFRAPADGWVATVPLGYKAWR